MKEFERKGKTQRGIPASTYLEILRFFKRKENREVKREGKNKVSEEKRGYVAKRGVWKVKDEAVLRSTGIKRDLFDLNEAVSSEGQHR